MISEEIKNKFKLTPKQAEVVELGIKGFESKDIKEMLKISYDAYSHRFYSIKKAFNIGRECRSYETFVYIKEIIEKENQ